MTDTIITGKKEVKSGTEFYEEEKAVLSQAARLLVRERLINAEEQMRFLSLLQEEG